MILVLSYFFEIAVIVMCLFWLYGSGNCNNLYDLFFDYGYI